MNILALDLGTKCGWGISAESNIHSGNQNFTASKKIIHPGYRFAEFRWLLTELKNTHDIDVVYYEVAHFFAKGKQAAMIRGGFVGVLLGWAYHHEIPVIGVSTSTLRASYGNNSKDRKAGKGFSIQAAQQIFGITTTSDDESDALMLLNHAIKSGAHNDQ